MKIAYLILAHNNFEHLNRLIKSIQSENCDIFVHIDQKSVFQEQNLRRNNYKNVKFLKKRISVNWGGFSIVEAEIALLKEAGLKYDYYILLSGNDYPIKNLDYLENYLSKNYGSNFINSLPLLLNSKKMKRMTNYYIEGGIRNKGIRASFLKMFNLVTNNLITKRKLPKKYANYEIYSGNQWWCLHKGFVEYFFGFLEENESFVNYYRNTSIPDEMFFQTILKNSPFHNTIEPAITYTDWEIFGPEFPATINEVHLSALSRDYTTTKYGPAYFCFARKFDDNSNNIIEKVNNIKNKI